MATKVPQTSTEGVAPSLPPSPTSPPRSSDDGAPPVPGQGGSEGGGGDDDRVDRAYARDYRFWCVVVSLCAMMLLSSLENTVVVTSLPAIVRDLELGGSYIWVTNAFFLAW